MLTQSRRSSRASSLHPGIRGIDSECKHTVHWAMILHCNHMDRINRPGLSTFSHTHKKKNHSSQPEISDDSLRFEAQLLSTCMVISAECVEVTADRCRHSQRSTSWYTDGKQCMTVSSLISTLTQTEGLVNTPMANKTWLCVCLSLAMIVNSHTWVYNVGHWDHPNRKRESGERRLLLTAPLSRGWGLWACGRVGELAN